MKQWLLDVAYLPLKCHILLQCWETPLNEPWEHAKSVTWPRKSFMSWNWQSQMNDHTYTVAALPFNLMPSNPLKTACWIVNDKDRYMNVPSQEDLVTSLFNRIHAMRLELVANTSHQCENVPIVEWTRAWNAEFGHLFICESQLVLPGRGGIPSCVPFRPFIFEIDEVMNEMLIYWSFVHR